jgi:Cu/Ag efflux protein CusF
MKFRALIGCLALLLTVLPLKAQDQSLGSANKEWAVAVVDRLMGNMGVQLKHGEVKNLDLGPGTTEFRVSGPDVFRQLRIGQQITFRAEKIGGRYVIVLVEPKP